MNLEKIKQELKIVATAFGVAVMLLVISVALGYALYRPKVDIKRGYEVAVSLDGKPVAKKEEKVVDFAQLFATADAARGEKIFKKCASCHTINKGEAAKVGPNLFGIVGRKRAAMPGFAYSSAMISKGGNWDNQSIDQFITKPKDFVAGTKMAFPGLKKPQERADVIKYLGSR